MNWTDERVELLRKLWAEGLSASQIAAQLGGVSRNAVIGKVHRLKLSSRGRAAPAQARQKKPKAAAPKAAKPSSQPVRSMPQTVGATALKVEFDAEPAPRPVARVDDSVILPISRNLKLVELTDRTCKWPNGDPLNEDFNFCGSASKDGSPYCAYHARVAYQPVSDRRRAR
ncbi:GcrA cell cycle regulator [Aquibium carbonis]|uniref:GcrA cell cycle regulator n=1 Tax=Aquibium carbonis TaxID=2495581 RepID=A0A3S0A1T2_9HYPH|nr:GcrA family cell cycle regulator [Aquibium carbonis]RST86893.1 GcrA cell cycle regulator [Aquibium carbonis]